MSDVSNKEADGCHELWEWLRDEGFTRALPDSDDFYHPATFFRTPTVPDGAEPVAWIHPRMLDRLRQDGYAYALLEDRDDGSTIALYTHPVPDGGEAIRGRAFPIPDEPAVMGGQWRFVPADEWGRTMAQVGDGSRFATLILRDGPDGGESPTVVEAEDGERKYPCDRCGKLRTKAEGGTVFTVCEKCWDETTGQPTEPVPEGEDVEALRVSPALGAFPQQVVRLVGPNGEPLAIGTEAQFRTALQRTTAGEGEA